MAKQADVSGTVKDFLAARLGEFQTANTAEDGQRAEGKIDLEFLNLKQWGKEKAAREDSGKPTLTIDQIGEPYRQLVGALRKAHPGIQVAPVDNGADKVTAERYQGAIRHIERTGGAKPAREEAFKGCVGPGWGYYRLYADWDYQDGAQDPAALFDQCIKYQPIENQFTVFRDPSCPIHEPWKARFCILVEDIPTDEFTRRWPDAITPNASTVFEASGMAMPDWHPTTSVRVADCFYLETVKGEEIALLDDGSTAPAKAVPVGRTVVQKRIPVQTIVKLAKITAAEILEGNDEKTGGREEPWPFIPVVPMYGEAITVDGKRYLRGIVRAARDPQRMYNYQNSELVYELALSPKSKVIMAEGQMEGYEAMWKNAPSSAHPALFYKPTALNGERVPEPHVAQFTDPAKIQALVVAINQHKADLRSTTGWYDATDPNRKNADQSGRAIQARKDAQAEGSVNFFESFSVAMLFEAMLLIGAHGRPGAIARLYNRKGRGIRIAGLEDETTSETLKIGDPYQTDDGKTAYFEWGAGRYDLAVSIGASYGTRRQEAAFAQIELMKALPEQMSAAMAPMAVRNMDWPGASEIADRLDATLPPEIRGDKDKKNAIPPEAMKAIQEAHQMVDMLTQQLNQATEAIKTDEVKRTAEVQKVQAIEANKLQIAQIEAESAALKVRADVMIALAGLDVKEGTAALQEETKRLAKLADLHIEAEQLTIQGKPQGGETVQ